VETKKAFERPETGPFYMVPDPKSGKYTIYVSFDSNPDIPGDEERPIATWGNLHLYLWDRIVELLRRRFRNSSVDILSTDYRGLPRGRVTIKGTNAWIVAWAEDFPLEEYKREIFSEFRLGDAEAINKVTWNSILMREWSPLKRPRLRGFSGSK
jgi:hypothetical protein